MIAARWRREHCRLCGEVRKSLNLRATVWLLTLVVETLVTMVVSDFLDGITDNFLVVKGGAGGDFTEDHDLEFGKDVVND